jgi:hypothetical protein
MDISYIETMKRIGQIVNHPLDERQLSIVTDPECKKEELKDKRGRVYAIVIDGKVHKLGGSQDKGGILSTIGFYFKGYAHNNSKRTYCVWRYLKNHLDKGSKIEVYCVWAPLTKIQIPTMKGSLTREIPVDFHTIENGFLQEYHRQEGKYPFLNMQENRCKWEDSGLEEGWPGMKSKRFGEHIEEKGLSKFFN